MYTEINYKTKRALIDAVASGAQVRVYQPNDLFGNPKAAPDYSGIATIEGPQYPQPHRWYAQVTIKNGIIVKVK